MSASRNRFFVCVCVAMLAAGLAGAQSLDPVQAEEQGIDVGGQGGASVGQRTYQQTTEATQLLLVPDWSNDRVMAFDAATGDLVDENFIPTDAINLASPKAAILKADGTSILVCDQLRDAVQEYDLDGNYVGIFAPAGGVNTAVLDNARGIRYHPTTGSLLVTIGSGGNQDAVAEFDASGAYLGTFVAPGAGGVDSPFDILVDAEALVTASTSDAVHRYDASTGGHLGDLVTGIDFPQQVAIAPSNGNILIAVWGGSFIREVQPDGTFVADYTIADDPRGVYELPNGNLLYANGSGVHEITRANTLVESKITGMSAQYIHLVEIPGANLVINEIDYDQAGTDTEEFLEIYNPTGSPVNLDGYTVELVNGSTDVIYDTIALPAVDLAPDDYFVICSNAATVPNCDLDDDPDTDFIQNGAPDAVGLRDGTGALVDAVSYEGDTTGYTEGSGVGLEDDDTIDYFSISRFPNGVDTDQNNVDLSGRCNSPGLPNFDTTSDCVQVPVELMSFTID